MADISASIVRTSSWYTSGGQNAGMRPKVSCVFEFDKDITKKKIISAVGTSTTVDQGRQYEPINSNFQQKMKYDNGKTIVRITFIRSYRVDPNNPLVKLLDDIQFAVPALPPPASLDFTFSFVIEGDAGGNDSATATDPNIPYEDFDPCDL